MLKGICFRNDHSCIPPIYQFMGNSMTLVCIGAIHRFPNGGGNTLILHMTNCPTSARLHHPERKAVFQPLFFRCYVSFKEGKSCANFLAEGATITVALRNCVSCSIKTKPVTFNSHLRMQIPDKNREKHRFTNCWQESAKSIIKIAPKLSPKLLKNENLLLPSAWKKLPNTLPWSNLTWNVLSSPSVLAALHSVAPGQWHSGRPRLWPSEGLAVFDGTCFLKNKGGMKKHWSWNSFKNRLLSWCVSRFRNLKSNWCPFPFEGFGVVT